jgi:hypothetical protein
MRISNPRAAPTLRPQLVNPFTLPDARRFVNFDPACDPDGLAPPRIEFRLLQFLKTFHHWAKIIARHIDSRSFRLIS